MDYRGRVARAQEALRAQNIDWLLVGPSADLFYLTGLHGKQGSRLTALLLPMTGPATLLVPALEATSLNEADLPARLISWPDGEDPLARVTEHLIAARTISISESLWARDVLPLQERLSQIRMVTATQILRPLRMVKDDEEISLMRQAGQAADRVVDRIATVGLEGKSEAEVAALINGLLIEEGHELVAFNIVASGPNGALPHHEISQRRILRGDLVVLDFGGVIKGYHSDTTRTLAVGDPSAEQRAVYEAVRMAQDIGVQAVRPGATTGSVDAATRSSLENAGYGDYFIHRTGHGLGLEVHEPPYLLSNDTIILVPGMVFSVEPGVYLPGSFGVRIEDIVVVTSHGAERLNNSDRGLRIVK